VARGNLIAYPLKGIVHLTLIPLACGMLAWLCFVLFHTFAHMLGYVFGFTLPWTFGGLVVWVVPLGAAVGAILVVRGWIVAMRSRREAYEPSRAPKP